MTSEYQSKYHYRLKYIQKLSVKLTNYVTCWNVVGMYDLYLLDILNKNLIDGLVLILHDLTKINHILQGGHNE